MLEALSASVQASALDLSQNGIATLEFQDQHRRLYHVTTLLVGRLGDLWEWTVLNHQHFPSLTDKHAKKCGAFRGIGHICIYIYIPLEVEGGPENDQKHGCEGAREELRGSLKRIAEAKNATKIRFREVSKSVEKSVVSPFWPAGHFPKPEKIAFFDSLRAPSQLFVLRVFLGFRGPVVERKSRKRFVSAGAVFGPPCFFGQTNGCPKKCEKCLRPKKTVRN